MTQAFDISAKADQKQEQLRAILYLLQSNLEEFTAVKDFDFIFKISDTLDNQVKTILDKFIKSFLQKHKTIIASAYRSKTSLNDLHYSIVLQEDTVENRKEIFAFFEKYDLLDISTKYPVYFQFVPVELVDKIRYTEALKFA